MKKTFIVVSIAIFVICMFSISVSASSTKEIRLLICDTPEESPRFYAQCKDYEKQTGIKIVWRTTAPDPGEISSSLVPAFKAKQTPTDILMVPFLGLLRKLADNGYMADMSDLAKEIDANWDWASGVLETCTASRTGNVFAIPSVAYINSVGVYRISFFKEHGLEAPKTWDDFLDVCEKIKNLNNGTPPIAMANTYGTRLLFEHLLLSFVSKEVWDDFTFGKIKASDPAIKEALRKIAILRDKGYVNDPMKEPEMCWGWWLGDYPIGLRQPGMVGMLGPDVSREDAYKDQSYLIISGKPGLPDGYCGALTVCSISKYSPVIEEAKKFLKWLSAPEKFVERSNPGDIPVIKSVGQEALDLETARMMEFLKGCEFRFDISDMVGGEWGHTLDQQVEMLLIKGSDYLDKAIEKLDEVSNPLSQR